MSLDANRAHPWATTTVWNAERFMQVQVRHIAAKVSWTTQSDLMKVNEDIYKSSNVYRYNIPERSC